MYIRFESWDQGSRIRICTKLPVDPENRHRSEQENARTTIWRWQKLCGLENNIFVWPTICKKKTNSDLNTNIQAGVGLESKHFYIDTTSSLLSHQLTLSHSFQPCSCWCQEVGSSHSWPLGLKYFLYFLKGKTLAKHFMKIWSGACSQCRLK